MSYIKVCRLAPPVKESILQTKISLHYLGQGDL